MSIGLVMDSILHMLLRYYESPKTEQDDKVKDALETMGSWILTGSMTTMLGVFLPLTFLFSCSNVMHTVLVVLMAVVVLGGSHGFVLFPILLSLWGPAATFRDGTTTTPSSENRSSKRVLDHEEILYKDWVDAIVG